MSRFLVSVERTIPVSRQQLFDVLADPSQHPVIDGSGSVRAARAGNPGRLSMGATFGMDMKLGAAYRITNTVVEFDEPGRIAWRHWGGHIWRYRFEPDGAGTRVIEQWDATAVWSRALLSVAGFPRRNRRGMLATLERLDALVSGSPDAPPA